jgi:Ribonucleotide reductase, small chain/SCP-2 sterol transfer family
MAHDTTSRLISAEELEQDIDRSAGAQIDLVRLYRLWEENNWSAYAIDFTQDARDWRERLTPLQRRAAHWSYALFLHGEEAVARTLAPFVGALWTQEQRVFITTQIVDEARHHVFFSRFMREVVGDGQDMASTLDAATPELTWGFRKVFAELDRVTDRLRYRQQDRALLAQSILLYHLIVEGALAHPGQRFIRGYLAAQQVLPGFAAGMAKIARDESRHMAFGLQTLKELIAQSPAIRQATLAMLNKVLPWTISVFVPPNFDEDYVRCFSYSLEDVYAFGLRSTEVKLARIGIPPSTVKGLVQVAVDQPPADQARRAVTLLRAGVLGVAAPLRLDDEIMRLLFDGLERIVNMGRVGDLPGAIQWEFSDAAPWYLLARAGQAQVRQGRAPAPALIIRCSAADWARIAGDKMDARWALLTRRLRISGDLRLALRLPALLDGKSA